MALEWEFELVIKSAGLWFGEPGLIFHNSWVTLVSYSFVRVVLSTAVLSLSPTFLIRYLLRKVEVKEIVNHFDT